MSVLKRRPTHADRLALWAWVAVAFTPAGWVLGIVLAFLSGDGEAKGIGPVTLGLLGILLFVTAPATAVVLAVQAARAGYRSGRIAMVVSGSPWTAAEVEAVADQLPGHLAALPYLGSACGMRQGNRLLVS